MKANEESFKGSGVIVTQAKVSLQTTDLPTQLLKIKEQYKCPAKFIETMESAKDTINEAVQAIQELDFGEDTCNINRLATFKKRMQNNDISKTINMKREGFHRLFTVYFNILSQQLLQ